MVFKYIQDRTKQVQDAHKMYIALHQIPNPEQYYSSVQKEIIEFYLERKIPSSLTFSILVGATHPSPDAKKVLDLLPPLCWQSYFRFHNWITGEAVFPKGTNNGLV